MGCDYNGFNPSQINAEQFNRDAEIADLKAIRDLLVKALCKSTGRAKEAVEIAPFEIACLHAKEITKLKQLLAEANTKLSEHESRAARSTVACLEVQRQLAEAKAVNQILWSNLTPDQRHLMNLRYGEVKP